eukprot:1139793-Pelagomonas_calceolata.AAC.2
MDWHPQLLAFPDEVAAQLHVPRCNSVSQQARSAGVTKFKLPQSAMDACKPSLKTNLDST